MLPVTLYFYPVIETGLLTNQSVSFPDFLSLGFFLNDCFYDNPVIATITPECYYWIFSENSYKSSQFISFTHFIKYGTSTSEVKIVLYKLQCCHQKGFITSSVTHFDLFNVLSHSMHHSSTIRTWCVGKGWLPGISSTSNVSINRIDTSCLDINQYLIVYIQLESKLSLL